MQGSGSSQYILMKRDKGSTVQQAKEGWMEGDSCEALFKSVFLYGKAEAMSSRWGCIDQNEHVLSNRVLPLWVTIKTALFRCSIRINFLSVLSLHAFAPLFIMAPITIDTIQFYNPLLFIS